MVLIAAGLAAIRATRWRRPVDGATEWQVFRRVTIPLLMPVLTVVLVTLVINVMKVFDLVYIIGGGDPNANVLALQMWTVSFGGGNDQGRRRHRRAAVRARAARHAVQHPANAAGAQMSTAEKVAKAPPADGGNGAAGAPRRGLAARIVGRMGGGVAQALLVLVALFWLVPTLGLLVASLRSNADNNSRMAGGTCSPSRRS